MKTKAEEKDILTTRGAAAAVVLLIGGPLFFLLWFKLAMASVGGAPFGWTWHVPALVTVGCTVLAYLMLEKLVDFVGHFISSILWWSP